MMVFKKKVCLLGSFAVGKTSLVRRYVKSCFSDDYITTVGVKVDKKELVYQNNKIIITLWDIQGEDEFQKIRWHYLRGMSGYILVVDGTRKNTLKIANDIRKRINETMDKTPCLFVFNKCDLVDQWDISDRIIERMTQKGMVTLKGSAKTGEGVELAFQELTKLMMEE